jgi:hypothetical protein
MKHLNLELELLEQRIAPGGFHGWCHNDSKSHGGSRSKSKSHGSRSKSKSHGSRSKSKSKSKSHSKSH